MKVKVTTLREIMKSIISSLGYDNTEVDAILGALLYSQMRGSNHGAIKLLGNGIIPKTKKNVEIEIVRESHVSALVHAHENQPMVVIMKAAEMATVKAKDHGVAVIGVHGTNSSSGALGYYVRSIAQQGLLGLAFSSSGGRVAPVGSFEPVLGTNPLAVAVPTEDEPFVLDMATSAIARFGVVEAQATGQILNDGVAYDKNGAATVEPAEALAGALRTFGDSYKSTGLSMVIQMIAGPLVGSDFNPDSAFAGHLIMAIDPEILGGLQAVREGASSIIRRVKSAKRLPDVREIIVAGERGDRRMSSVLATGEIEIEDNVFAELKKRAHLN